MSFKEIKYEELNINPMTLIGESWWLITAGNNDSGYNTMTASWGNLGSLWERPGRKAHAGLPTATVYLRPQRYTKEFMDNNDTFTLTIMDPSFKRALGYLGSHSGRNEDKIVNAGLTPIFEDKYTYFNEAKLVFVCKKIYHAPIIEEGFVDTSIISSNYPNKDFHEMYIGEIIKVLVAD